MIVGNLMLLCRFHPNQVYKWFMELFIDSLIVMVPNVYGMSQFSLEDYLQPNHIFGSNYIEKCLTINLKIGAQLGIVFFDIYR